jgi:hypothetical protein
LENGIVGDATLSGPVYALTKLTDLDEAKVMTIFIIFVTLVLEPLSIGLAVATSAVWQSGPKMTEHKTAGRPAEPAKKPAKTAETAKMPPKTAEAAKVPVKTAEPLTVELRAIQERHSLTIKDLARITGRKHLRTVEGWLTGKPEIPIKAMRLIRKWSKENPAIRIVKSQANG